MKNIQEILASNPILKIDLGCGQNKKEGFIGIDSLPLEGVDFIANIEEGLSFLPDNSVDELYSSHVLEHIENFEFLMKEIHRVLKPNGTKYIIVPHFSNPYYYSDYTHRRFFGLYSMDYFSNGANKMGRKVPVFYNDFKFEIKFRKLRFTSAFYFRNKLKALITRIVNISPFFQELYEEFFTGFLGCAEVHFIVKPIK